MDLPEVSSFDDVYLVDDDDPVEGGLDGIDNKQGRALTNRTVYLKDNIGDMSEIM
jgi:hypothetical protein